MYETYSGRIRTLSHFRVRILNGAKAIKSNNVADIGAEIYLFLKKNKISTSTKLVEKIESAWHETNVLRLTCVGAYDEICCTIHPEKKPQSHFHRTE